MRMLDLFESDRNIIDNKDGWGATPNNQEVDYLGLRVTMTPKRFIDLAAPLGREPSEEIQQHLKQGGTIGAPFLIIEIPESWKDGDFDMPARIVGHEGRNRMIAVEQVFGNNPIETHLFFSHGLRNRHITADYKKHLNKILIKEKSKTLVSGPFFNLTESILNKTTTKNITEGIMLQLERDRRANLLVLHIKDTETGRRSEVRGKLGYETRGYDANDPLHQLLDKISKTANISELMNGELVSINPKHPQAASAIAAAKKITNEAFDTEAKWVLGYEHGAEKVFATKIDDAYIELTYKKLSNGDLYISFTRGGRMAVTGEGNQNKIFGAVINHIKSYAAQTNPKRLVFSAFKPNTGPFGTQDTTRSGLYSRMVQRFANQNGYDFEVQDTGSEDTFVLTRQNNETALSTLEQAIIEGGHTLEETIVKPKVKHKINIYNTLINEKYKHGDYARGGKPMPKAKKGRTKHPLHGKLVGS
jgi:hypothetical protein